MTQAKRYALLAATVLAAALGGCGEGPAETPAPPGPTPNDAPQLTVGHVGHDHHLALYVAALEGEALAGADATHLREVKEKEVYDLVDGGTVVARLRFLKVGGGSNMPAAMSRGEIDVGLGGIAAIAKFVDGGQPFKVLMPLQTDGDMLVMATGSPVRTWDAFVEAAKAGREPLKIGYKAPTAVAKMIFERALVAEGVPYSFDATGEGGVVLVNFGSEKSPIPMLESGAIDGFVMNQPAVAVAESKGLGHTVCQLRDLPPEGQWIDHPCCCVVATETVLAEHRAALVGLAKVLLLATERIRTDPRRAVELASQWTKYPVEVEGASVPTVTYVAEPTESWRAGMRTWHAMVQDIHFFKGQYADVTPEAFLEDLCALDVVREAARALREEGRLPAP